MLTYIVKATWKDLNERCHLPFRDLFGKQLPENGSLRKRNDERLILAGGVFFIFDSRCALPIEEGKSGCFSKKQLEIKSNKY